VDLVLLVVVLELADVLAERVAGVVALVVEEIDAARPPYVERIERPVDLQQLRRAVVRVGVGEAELREAVAEVRIEEAQRDRLAVDAVVPLDADALPGAEQVLLLQLHAEGVLAALRLKLTPGLSVHTSRVRTSRSTA